MDLDFSFITNFFHDAFAMMDYMQNFFTQGIYTLWTKLIAYLIEIWTIFSINSAIFFMGVANDIAQQILADLNISAILASAYASIDVDLMYFLTSLRVPESLNNILSGLATGFVMRFMP